MNRQDILDSIRWGLEVEVQTQYGPRLVKSARANKKVQALFAESPAELRQMGYTLKADESGGEFTVKLWRIKTTEEIKAVESSRATDAEIEVPVPAGQELLGFQKAGVKYALDRGRALIADEPGLGKSCQACALLNLLPDAKRILVVCPASLKINWFRELKKWMTIERPIYIVDRKRFPFKEEDDSEGIAILNYETLACWRKSLLAIEWDVFVCDEAHYIKNKKALRSKQILGERATKEEKAKGMADVPGIVAKRVVFLTGTPIDNHPKDLFSLIEYLDPETWSAGFFQFGLRYCDGCQKTIRRQRVYDTAQGKYVVKEIKAWNFDGTSHLEELQEKLRRTVMIRRLKAEVLPFLPAKRYQVIELPAEGPLERFSGADKGLKIDEMSAFRRDLGIAKIPAAISFLRAALEESPKIVVLAYHTEVAKQIADEFKPGSVRLIGETSLMDRQNAVDRFQTDPSCHLFVGSIGSASVGLTLTAADRLIYVEQDWRPGVMAQGEDRIHRIGQKRSVLIQYLVVAGTLDVRIAEQEAEKQRLIDKTLDEGVKKEGEK